MLNTKIKVEENKSDHPRPKIKLSFTTSLEKGISCSVNLYQLVNPNLMT
jgi:hypothetical protein